MACSLFAGIARLAWQEGGMVWSIVVLVVLAGLVMGMTVVGVMTRKSSDDSPMPLPQRWFLVAYLLLMGAVLVYFLAVISSKEFPEASMSVGVSSGGQDAPPVGSPALKHIGLERLKDDSPDLSLVLYGENIQAGAGVRINSPKERGATMSEEGRVLETPLLASDLNESGTLTVAIVNPDKKVSNSVKLQVNKPYVTIDVLGWQLCVTRELQLVLLVLLAGALGSYLHAIRSLADFIGNRTAMASWFWWYIARPFVGMAMALIFYAVLRGGFLAGTPADAKVVNPFGVIAIGALVGMFADKAAQKLAEVFDTLFKAADTRKDKLISPVVDKLQPDHAAPGATPLPEITISGTHLSVIEKIRVNQQDRVPKSVDDKQVKIVLTAPDVAQVAEITLALVDKSGTVTSAGTFFVTDLAINGPAGQPAADTLTPGAHGAAYGPLTFTASGGTGPYKWGLAAPLAGFAIGADNGQLSGTPATAGNCIVNLRVTDSRHASVTKAYKLTVT